MTDSIKAALEMLQGQLKELDDIHQQVERDLNTVAATERVAKWKDRTTTLVAQLIGQPEAKRFADTRPGPSFTNDMLEEIGDIVETYRTAILALTTKVKARKTGP